MFNKETRRGLDEKEEFENFEGTANRFENVGGDEKDPYDLKFFSHDEQHFNDLNDFYKDFLTRER